jgi:hypothetical protein
MADPIQSCNHWYCQPIFILGIVVALLLLALSKAATFAIASLTSSLAFWQPCSSNGGLAA